MGRSNKYKVRLMDGVLYNPWTPAGKPPSPETVAWGLARLNRYGGHTTRPISVAEHSLWVCAWLAAGGDSDVLQDLANVINSPYAFVRCLQDSPHTGLALFGLIHDAPEGCGLVDVPGPVGRHEEMSEYKEAHERCMAWLCKGWGIAPPPFPPVVKMADVATLGPELDIRPKAAEAKDGSGEDVPRWQGIDFAGRHNLHERLGEVKIRELWIDAFHTLHKELKK